MYVIGIAIFVSFKYNYFIICYNYVIEVPRMTRNELYARLNTVFRDVFDDDSITVTDTSCADDIEGWDSLSHIDLIVAVETEFNMKFNMGETTRLHNVGEMVDIILDRINGTAEDRH